MKFTTPHLIGAAAMLVGSIAYNVWVFSGSSPSKQRPRAIGTADARGGGGPPASPPVDPAEIPAPPPVDVTTEPAWDRDPFRRAGASEWVAAPATAPVAAVTSDPVVRSILYSTQRRLAIVDGRIVGVGDRLPSGVAVVDIARDAVLVRMPSGEQRRLALRPSSPGAPR